jgi:serine/threonine-protein kinase
MSPTSVAGGRYELLGVVGRGGMALVFLARDHERDETVAVKLLADNLSADPELRERFRREAELAQRLSHPNVVRVLGSGETDGRAYIVLEYVDGGSLADELLRDGALPAGRVAALGAQAAAGLAHAHRCGLVHRDVKPQNLLLEGSGTLKVSDFGVARALDGTRLTRAGWVIGTAAYLAPEQARGEEVTPAADVYGLGVVLHELATGGPPGEPMPVEAPELESVVLSCLRDDPGARPTARDVERMLRGGLAAPTRVLRPRAAAPTEVLRPGRGQGKALAAAVVVVAAGILIGLGLSGGGAAKHPPAAKPVIAPIRTGQTPAASADNLARWLRANSR